MRIFTCARSQVKFNFSFHFRRFSDQNSRTLNLLHRCAKYRKPRASIIPITLQSYYRILAPGQLVFRQWSAFLNSVIIHYVWSVHSGPNINKVKNIIPGRDHTSGCLLTYLALSSCFEPGLTVIRALQFKAFFTDVAVLKHAQYVQSLPIYTHTRFDDVILRPSALMSALIACLCDAVN